MADKKIQPGKLEAVAALKEQFSEAKDFIFVDYRGLTVEQITELRVKLANVGAELHVVKNNFAKIAFKQLEKEGVDDLLVGPTALAFVKEDAGPAAKEILDSAKGTTLGIKGGLIDGNIFDEAQVVAVSKLPTRLEMIQILMGTMQAPVQNVVYVLNGVVTKLVRTLDAVREQKEKEA